MKNSESYSALPGTETQEHDKNQRCQIGLHGIRKLNWAGYISKRRS